ncbi:hypothetical protein K8R62_03755, partial [bacterium]|nr:hypothetical protein [bacterium]
ANTVPGILKNIIDRFLPTLNFSLEYNNGRYMHGFKPGFNPGSFVLISSCNYWGIDGFDLIVKSFQELLNNYPGSKLAGSLFRPHSSIFRSGAGFNSIGAQEIIEASKVAARELFKKGEIFTRTEKTISKELISEKEFVRLINFYDKQMDKK